jgi:hypothetical protein
MIDATRQQATNHCTTQSGKDRARARWPHPGRKRLPNRRALPRRLKQTRKQGADRNRWTRPLARLASDDNRGPIRSQGLDHGDGLNDMKRSAGEQRHPRATGAQLAQFGAILGDIGEGATGAERHIATEVDHQGGAGRLTQPQSAEERQHRICGLHAQHPMTPRDSPHPHHVIEIISPAPP